MTHLFALWWNVSAGRLPSRARARYNLIARVSGESDNLRSGSGLVLTPRTGAASRHEGKS
jgi:hypothetical protein